MLTVNEHRRPISVCDYAQEANDIFILNAPGSHWYVFVIQSGTFKLIFVRVKRTEVNDCLNCHLLKPSHPISSGLGASVQILSDAVQIG